MYLYVINSLERKVCVLKPKVWGEGWFLSYVLLYVLLCINLAALSTLVQCVKVL